MQNRRNEDIYTYTNTDAYLCMRVRAEIRGRFAGSRASNAKPTDNVHTTYLLRHTYVCMHIADVCTRRSNVPQRQRRRRLTDITIITLNFIILIIAITIIIVIIVVYYYCH